MVSYEYNRASLYQIESQGQAAKQLLGEVLPFLLEIC